MFSQLSCAAGSSRSPSAAALISRLGLNPALRAQAASAASGASCIQVQCIATAAHAAALASAPAGLVSIGCADAAAALRWSTRCHIARGYATFTPSQLHPEAKESGTPDAGKREGRSFQVEGREGAAEAEAAEGADAEIAEEEDDGELHAGFYPTAEGMLQAVRGVQPAGLSEAQLDDAVVEKLAGTLEGVGERAKDRLLFHVFRGLLAEPVAPELAESLARAAPRLGSAIADRWPRSFFGFYVARNQEADWRRWHERALAAAGSPEALTPSYRLELACGHMLRGDFDGAAGFLQGRQIETALVHAAWRATAIRAGAVAGSAEGLVDPAECLRRFLAARTARPDARESGARALLAGLLSAPRLRAASGESLARALADFAGAMRPLDGALADAVVQLACEPLRLWGALGPFLEAQLPGLAARPAALRQGGAALTEAEAAAGRGRLVVHAALELASEAARRGAAAEAAELLLLAAHAQRAAGPDAPPPQGRAVTGALAEIALAGGPGEALLRPVRSVAALPDGLAFLGGEPGLQDLAVFVAALGNATTARELSSLARERRMQAPEEAPAAPRLASWVGVVGRNGFTRARDAARDAVARGQVPGQIAVMAAAAGYLGEPWREAAVRELLAGPADVARALEEPARLLLEMRTMPGPALLDALRELCLSLEKRPAPRAGQREAEGRRAAVLAGVRRTMARNACQLAAFRLALAAPREADGVSDAVRAAHRLVEATGELPETLLRALFRALGGTQAQAGPALAKLWTKLRSVRRARAQRKRAATAGRSDAPRREAPAPPSE